VKPIAFPMQNIVVAKDQPPYLALPAYVDNQETISCWRLTLWERLRLLFRGCVWVRQLNFGRPLQAIELNTLSPWSQEYAIENFDPGRIVGHDRAYLQHEKQHEVDREEQRARMRDA